MWKMSESGVSVDIPDNGIQYVLDGGALLQRIRGLVALHMEISAISTQNMYAESIRMV